MLFFALFKHFEIVKIFIKFIKSGFFVYWGGCYGRGENKPD